ncbi:DNA-binding anti-repressor SinI [Bacillus suaedae]|uniref:Anti-repressor SinI family protein n=1 Tax=Halalkalibacter suaedae TaxID=2822140 RepID=A0A940WW24_9BACI|nr:DNA-binding anti-repressor SinI [Bacillus suaedae]MBP3951532.1 anti-repressor SinI family protein [Bacillus suaedae]
MDKKDSVDYEWIRLFLEAKELGLTVDEIKDYFYSQTSKT